MIRVLRTPIRMLFRESFGTVFELFADYVRHRPDTTTSHASSFYFLLYYAYYGVVTSCIIVAVAVIGIW